MPPPRLTPLKRRRPLLLLLAPGLLICLLLATVVHAVFFASSGGDAATRAALRSARTEMVWTHGPSIAHRRSTTVGALPGILRTLATSTLRSDVNTADLIRRFGPRRAVDVIILSGVYNSLPPDEGVDVQGEVLVLVDPHTDRVLFLTA